MTRRERATHARDAVACCSPLAKEPLSAADADELASVLKALSDPVRLRLLSMIASHPDGETCVCDLAEVFALSAPTISYHLKVLRLAGLVTTERRRTWVYYRVRPTVLSGLSRVLGADLSDVSVPAQRSGEPASTADVHIDTGPLLLTR